jgi:hypothetical protein
VFKSYWEEGGSRLPGREADIGSSGATKDDWDDTRMKRKKKT